MISNGFVFAIFGGVALALPYLFYACTAPDRRRVLGIGLTVAALVYVGFAVSGGTLKELLIELVGVVLFGMFAVLGIRQSPYFLALGWVIHVSWDLLLHPIDISTFTPWWYPAACIGFDLVVAGAVFGGLWQHRSAATGGSQ